MNWLRRHSGEITAFAGLAGLGATVAFAIKAAPKAKDILTDLELQINQKPKFKQKVKATWKVWMPTIVTGTLSVACVVGGICIKKRQTSLLSAALATSELAMSNYQRAVIDKIGVDAEKEIHKVFTQKQYPETNQIANTIIESVDECAVVDCWDAFTQTPFKASVSQLKSWIAEKNNEINTNYTGAVSLTDYFDTFDIRQSCVADKIYWDYDHYVDLAMESAIIRGRPYVCVEPRGFTMEGV